MFLEFGVIGETEGLQKLSVEFGFEALNRDEAAIGTGLCAAPVWAVQEDVAARFGQVACLEHGHQKVHHMG